MKGVALARDMAVLGAECALAVPADQVPDAHVGFPARPEAWAALREALAAYEASGSPRWARVLELGGTRAAAWLLLACAAVEVHPEAAAAFGLMSEDDRTQLVTPAGFARVAVSALGVDYVDALTEVLAGGPHRLGLLEVVDAARSRPAAQHGVRLATSELARLIGAPDTTGAPAAVRREAPAQAAGHDDGLVRAAGALLTEHGALLLRARSPRTARQLALDLAASRGLTAYVIDATEQLPHVHELLRLRGGLLVLDLGRDGGTARETFVTELAGRVSPLVVIGDRVDVDLPALDVAPLDIATAARVWAQVAGADDARWLGRRFRVGIDEARAAARDAATRTRVAGRAAPGRDDLAASVRAQGARRMGRAVSVVRTTARLDDLVAPPAVRDQIEDILAWYRAGDRTWQELGLRDQGALGRGLACLFSGPPGTGKTFAAQCLANELGLNLYRIDLSQVVSKYIGETEKALAQVFDEAEAGHGVLLFDEADALFGKRTEVKDAHDRYANVEVGYLLQRLEEFDGVGILTTNLRNNMDAAFIRRLRFVIEFPLPDQPWRRGLWDRSVPSRRAAGLDLEPFVERFRLSGGNIHNIGVAAAHLAAATADGVVTAAILVRATHRELEKAGMPRSAAEFGPLARFLPGAPR